MRVTYGLFDSRGRVAAPDTCDPFVGYGLVDVEAPETFYLPISPTPDFDLDMWQQNIALANRRAEMQALPDIRDRFVGHTLRGIFSYDISGEINFMDGDYYASVYGKSVQPPETELTVLAVEGDTLKTSAGDWFTGPWRYRSHDNPQF